jgi:hypothetical protein
MSAQTEAPNQNLLKPARNQLGIIALLTVLIYALASVVIGFSGHIDPSQKWPLVWFLVLFPLLVLGIFGWLVSRHHVKLYSAAADSTATGFFVTTLTADQQRRKLTRSIGAIDGSESLSSTNLITTDPDAELAGAAASYDPRAIYIIAEDLALRRIEIERGPSFMRHVTLEGVPFDGVIVKDDKVMAVQVAFMASPHVRPGFTGALLDNAEYASTRLKLTRPGSSFTLLLAVVTQIAEQEQAQLKSSLIGKFGATPVDIDIEFFDFEQLQNEFTNAGLDD